MTSPENSEVQSHFWRVRSEGIKQAAEGSLIRALNQ